MIRPNKFQKELFKSLNFGDVEVSDPRMQKLLEVTKNRKCMLVALTEGSPYNGYWLHWDVAVYSADLDLPNLMQAVTDNLPQNVADWDGVKRLIESVYGDMEGDLFNTACEQACESLDDRSDDYVTYFRDETVRFQFGLQGRSGKHFVLTEFNDLELRKSFDFEDQLEAMDDSTLGTLLLLKLSLDEELAPAAVTGEVEYQAAQAIAWQVEAEFASRNIGKWDVKAAFVYNDVQYYRAVNTATNEESMLGTLAECQAIVKYAEAGELKGSFGLMQLKSAATAGVTG